MCALLDLDITGLRVYSLHVYTRVIVVVIVIVVIPSCGERRVSERARDHCMDTTNTRDLHNVSVPNDNYSMGNYYYYRRRRLASCKLGGF